MEVSNLVATATATAPLPPLAVAVAVAVAVAGGDLAPAGSRSKNKVFERHGL